MKSILKTAIIQNLSHSTVHNQKSKINFVVLQGVAQNWMNVTVQYHLAMVYTPDCWIRTYCTLWGHRV